MSAKPEPLFVGGGRMASAMLSGLARAGGTATVVDPALPALPATVVAGAGALPNGFVPSLVVLAVKPQVAEAVMAALPAWDAPVLSIMAGCRLAWLRARLPGAGTIVRSMPNTPGAVGRGIAVAIAERPDPAAESLAGAVLGAMGEVIWTEDEAQIDVVAGLSGGGPAYVFYLVECLTEAGVAEGLPRAMAGRLARATVAGSGALLDASPEPPEVLRRNVTSPGGTTERAMAVLSQAWPDAVTRAVGAAAARAREL